MENTENIQKGVVPQQLNFKSSDIGLMRIDEQIKECLALVQAENQLKEGAKGEGTKSSAMINMSFGSQHQTSSKNYFTESTQKYNNSKK